MTEFSYLSPLETDWVWSHHFSLSVANGDKLGMITPNILYLQTYDYSDFFNQLQLHYSWSRLGQNSSNSWMLNLKVCWWKHKHSSSLLPSTSPSIYLGYSWMIAYNMYDQGKTCYSPSTVEILHQFAESWMLRTHFIVPVYQLFFLGVRNI